MSAIVFELFVILVLILFNGLLSMSEIAIVSARRVRLEQRAEEQHDAGAKVALELAAEPSTFLATVQVGITLVGILSGALGGARLTNILADLLVQVPVIGAYSQTISITLVVILITYLTLVIGELAPKQIALNNAERIASAVAPAMRTLARLTSPLVRLLSASTDGVLKLLGVKPNEELPVTEEEVRTMIEQGTQVGVFEPIEEEIVGQVFRLSDRTVSALYTPRTDIVWLDIDDPPEVIKQAVLENGYSRYPVAQGNLDNVHGMVSAQALLAQSLTDQPFDLKSVLQPALFIPETTPALVVVERLKQTRTHLALVIDEYGGVEGLVTLDDILTAIVGDMPDPDEPEDAEAVQRDDGSWLLDGMFQVDDFKDLLEIETLPEVGEGYYQTVGGLVMAVLGRIPTPGDYFEWAGLRIEVVDMDSRRVDKVLVTRLPVVEEYSHEK